MRTSIKQLYSIYSVMLVASVSFDFHNYFRFHMKMSRRSPGMHGLRTAGDDGGFGFETDILF